MAQELCVTNQQLSAPTVSQFGWKLLRIFFLDKAYFQGRCLPSREKQNGDGLSKFIFLVENAIFFYLCNIIYMASGVLHGMMRNDNVMIMQGIANGN